MIKARVDSPGKSDADEAAVNFLYIFFMLSVFLPLHSLQVSP